MSTLQAVQFLQEKTTEELIYNITLNFLRKFIFSIMLCLNYSRRCSVFKLFFSKTRCVDPTFSWILPNSSDTALLQYRKHCTPSMLVTLYFKLEIGRPVDSRCE